MTTVEYDVYRVPSYSDLIKFQIQLELGLEPDVLAAGFLADEADDDLVGKMHRFASGARHDPSVNRSAAEATTDDRTFLAVAVEYALGSTGNTRYATAGLRAPVESFTEARKFTEMHDVILSKFTGVSPYVRVTDSAAPEPLRNYEIVVPTHVHQDATG